MSIAAQAPQDEICASLHHNSPRAVASLWSARAACLPLSNFFGRTALMRLWKSPKLRAKPAHPKADEVWGYPTGKLIRL
jgi:hypothetical protein